MIQRLRARIAWFMALLLWVLTLGRAELDWVGTRGSHPRAEQHASQAVEADPTPGLSDAGGAGPTAPPTRR